MKRIDMMLGVADKYRQLHDKYTGQIARMAQEKMDFVDDIFCCWSANDGYVLCTTELEGGLIEVPVEQFFNVFGRRRKISAEEFLELSKPAYV